jgi:PPOX class probable F420-dependent enzyme
VVPSRFSFGWYGKPSVPIPKILLKESMNVIPDSHKDLLEDEAGAFAFLSTLMADGSPQLTPLWFNTDGKYILINSARGRVKDINMRARPQIALLITDPKDPFYRYLQIRGRVIEIMEEGALEHINLLSIKYDHKPWQAVAGQTRVIYKILPENYSARN